MKKNCFQWLLSAILVSAIALSSSCSSKSDDQKTDTPSFPEEQTLNVQAGNQQVYSFHANMNWKLSTSTPWCKIIDNGMEVYDISGTTGNQNVTILVTDDGQGFSEDEAELKLTMGGTSKTVAKIRRAAKEYEVHLLDVNGNELNELAITHSTYTVFYVTTNFEYATTSDDKIDFQDAVAGEAGKKLVTGAMIKDDYLTRPITKNDNVQLTFYNTNGDKIVSYPITYEGIDNTFVKVKDNDSYQWQLSLDGKTFRNGLGKYDLSGNIQSGSYEEKKDQLTYSVLVLNDKYKYMFIQVDGKGKVSRPSSEWIHTTQDTTNPIQSVVTADASTSYRTGCILVFPEAAYNTANADIQEGNDYQAIKEKYKANILTELVQQDANIEFDIRDGVNDWNRLNGYTKVTDQSELDFCKTHFSLTNVFTTYVSAKSSLIIFPMYHETSKDSKSVYKSYGIYKTDGSLDTDMTPSVDDTQNNKYSEEVFDDEGFMMWYVNIRNFSHKDAFYVVFRTQNGTNEKVLKVIVMK